MTAIGLWTPATASQQAEDPASRYVRTFLTYTELGGDPVDEAWIVSRLEKMSAYDCLQAIGRLSCMVDAAPLGDPNQQLRIMERLGWPQAVRDRVEPILRSNGGRTLFFPQQLVHLSRLAVLHADPRPMDNFGNHALVDDFIQCVLGVTRVARGGRRGSRARGKPGQLDPASDHDQRAPGQRGYVGALLRHFRSHVGLGCYPGGI